MAHMQDKRIATKVLIGKGEEKSKLEEPGIDGYIFKEQTRVERRELNSSRAGNREVAGPYEHQNKTVS